MIAGTLELQMLADIARLKQDMATIKTTVTDTMTAVDKAIGNVKSSLEKLFAGATIAGFTLMAKGALELQAQYVKLAEVAGTTAASISAFDLPARLAGVSLDAVASSIARLSRSIGEARLGDVNKGGLLAALGIDVSDGRDAAEQFAELGKVLIGMKDQTIASAVSTQLLGRGFAEMRPVFKEIIELGALQPRLSDEQAQAAKHLTDQLVLQKFQFDQNLNLLLTGVMPALEDLGKAFTGSAADAKQLSDFGEVLGDVLKGLGSLAFAAGDIFYGLGHQIGAIGAAAVALAHGEFKAAYQVIEDANAEVEKHTVETNQRIAKLWAERSSGGAGAMGDFGSIKDDFDFLRSLFAQEAIQQRMDDQKHAEERVKQLQSSGAIYAAMAKFNEQLADDAFKQGGIDNLRTQTALVEQKSALDRNYLEMLQGTYDQIAEIYRGQGNLAKMAEFQGKAAEINQKIILDEGLKNQKIVTMTAVTRAQQEQAYRDWLSSMEKAGSSVFDSERDIEQRQYDLRIQQLEVFMKTDETLEAQGNARKQIMADEHARAMVRIAQSEWQNRVLFAQFTNRDLITVNEYLFGVLAGLMNSGSRRLFEIGKIASEANALIKTYEAANNAFAAGSAINIYAGFAFMAAAIAAGLVNVQKIHATQFGGGSSGSSSSVNVPGVGGPATPVTSVPAAPPASQSGSGITVVVQGNFIGTDDYLRRTVIPAIRNAVGNNDEIIIPQNSRQAFNLKQPA